MTHQNSSKQNSDDESAPIAFLDQSQHDDSITHLRSAQDEELIRNLVDSFRKYGVVIRATITMEAADSFHDMLSSAALDARPEEFTNPKYYRPEVEALITQREIDEGDPFENPMLTYDDEPDTIC
jgi:hypothetical protein